MTKEKLNNCEIELLNIDANQIIEAMAQDIDNIIKSIDAEQEQKQNGI